MKCICCNETIRARDERATITIGGQDLAACLPCQRADLVEVFTSYYAQPDYAQGGALVKSKGASKAVALSRCHFVVEAGKVLARVGAVWLREESGACRCYELATPAGPLRVSVYGNWIATRFASNRGGTLATGGQSNRSSGKWNFGPWNNHADDGLQCMVDYFAANLRELLAFEPTAAEKATIGADLAEGEALRASMMAYFAEMEAARELAATDPVNDWKSAAA